MSEPAIRALVSGDLSEAYRLSTTVGWNQRLDDWRMLLRLASAGAFAAVIDRRLIGTAIGIDYGGFGWIAMMIVDPSYRGRGIGRRLLEAAIDAVPANIPIRLDATPLGRRLYQRYGFEDETTLGRFACDLCRGAGVRTGVRPLTPSDLETIVEQDRATFGGTRGALLDWQFHGATHYAYVMRDDDEGPLHYCLGRSGRVFDQIGPVVAGHENIAQTLVSAALTAAGDRKVVIDAFDAQSAFIGWLRTRGFALQRPLVRMCRQAQLRASATAVRSDRVTEFAIVGPEFA